MNKIFTLTFCLLIATIGRAQLDEKWINFPNPSNPAKPVYLYVPSKYNPAKPNKLMVGFHPFNPNKWNGKIWRDSLVNFAESRDLILLCPDGGVDGRIDDQFDYDFTTAMIDSAQNWYNVDTSGIYAMGFSVGGKAVYEYGLTHRDVFAGLMPIGAAVNGTTEIQHLLNKAACVQFYIIHGKQDNPNSRYYPIKDSLEQHYATVESMLIDGVGHTFTFQNRDQFLKLAFNWLDTATCKTTVGVADAVSNQFRLWPERLRVGDPIYLSTEQSAGQIQVEVHSLEGKKVWAEALIFPGQGTLEIRPELSTPGLYLVVIRQAGQLYSQKILVE